MDPHPHPIPTKKFETSAVAYEKCPQYDLSEFEAMSCSQITQKSEFENIQRCLVAEGKDMIRCPHGSQLVWFLMGLYQIIANALLLNLLIAMFSNTFDRINADAALVWKFQVF